MATNDSTNTAGVPQLTLDDYPRSPGDFGTAPKACSCRNSPSSNVTSGQPPR